MMMSPEIHPWAKYRSILINELDANKIWFEHACNLSRKQLGESYGIVKDGSSFFLALENNFEENDLMDFFINLFSHMEFHIDFENVSEKIKEYKHKLDEAKRKCLHLGIWRDKNFVGRKKEIDDIENILQDENIRGVSVCGLGGMGKTSLANHVCLQLHQSYPRWSLIKIDLREQRTVRDLVRLTNVQVDLSECNRPSDDDWSTDKEMDKEMKYLINYICDIKRRTVILFDNIDDIIVMDGERTKVMKFLSDLLYRLVDAGSKCGVRVMITSRQTLLPLISHSNLLREIEVKQLDPDEAEHLFDKCTSKVTYPTAPSDRAEIVKLCGYCPLAIRTLCSTLWRNRIPTSKLVTILKASPHGTEVMSMKACLQQTFSRLSEHYQERLLYLNLFTTAKFTMDAAVAVLTKDSKISESDKYATLLDLVYLKGQHLLEVSDDAFCKEGINTGRYSLHPLVHQFLSDKAENSDYSEGLQQAKERFIIYYHKIALDMSRKLKISLKSMIGMVDEMTHLRKFYDYLKFSPVCLNVSHYRSEMARVSSVSLIADLCSFLSPHHDRYELYDMLIRHSEGEGEMVEMVIWKTEKAKLLFEMGKHDESRKIVEEISSINLGNTDESWKLPAYANFLLLKARIENKLQKKEDAMKSLKLAICLYKKTVGSDPLYKTDLANVYNTLGCVFYDKDMLEESEKYHRLALGETNGEDANTVNFLANLGTCCLALGHKSSNKSDKKKYFKEAERYYSESLGLGDRSDDRRARKLINRSKLYSLPEMEKFEQGWEDLEEAVGILERTLIPPHESLTLGYHEKGNFLRYWASNCYKVKKDKELVKRHYQEAEKCYNQVIVELKRGGLHATSQHYHAIKENHKKILKHLHKSQEWEEAQKFYADFESGRYERRGHKAGCIEETMEVSKRQSTLGQQGLSQDRSSSSDDDTSFLSSSPSHSESHSSSYDSSGTENSMEEDMEGLGTSHHDPSQQQDKGTANNFPTTHDIGGQMEPHLYKTIRHDSGIGEGLSSISTTHSTESTMVLHPEGTSRQDSGMGGSLSSVSAIHSRGGQNEPYPEWTLRHDSGIGGSLSSVSTQHSTGRWRESRPILKSKASGSLEEDVFTEDTHGGRKLTSLSSMSSVEEARSDSFDVKDFNTFDEIMKSKVKRTKKLKRQHEIEEGLVGSMKKMKE